MKLEQAIIKTRKANPTATLQKIADKLGCSYWKVHKTLRQANLPTARQLKDVADIPDIICEARTKRAEKNVKRENEQLKSRLIELEDQLELVKVLKAGYGGRAIVIKTNKAETSSATAFAIASDWHAEERVKPQTVNGKNEFTLDIAEQRIEKFFQSTLRLLKNKQKDIKIDTLVLALLGDFISGSIHEDTMESAQLPPSQALAWVFSQISTGIRFLLAHTTVKLIIPCHSGNHGRFTPKQRISNEAGNSYEFLSYHFLAKEFANEKRVEFRVSEGYHSFMDIDGFIIRFHHGHFVKYGGGIGGIYIPTHKAIGEWNKANRADLDVFGHFHQQIFSPMFVCNGSLIGYSPFAISIKGAFQKPTQAFFLVHHQRHEVIDQCPIWLD